MPCITVILFWIFNPANTLVNIDKQICIFKLHCKVPEIHSFSCILNKIINAPCGTWKLLLALGVAKYIKSYKIHFVVQYATDYCPLEHDNYKTISAHLGSPISCYINNLHGAFIFLLSVYCAISISN